jgi:outer membrane protein TolC
MAIGISVSALTLAGCSLAPEYARPALPVPTALADTDSPEAPLDFYGLYKTGWRDFFSDPRLQALIETSLRSNLDLRMAVIAIGEARARYGVARSQRLLM